MRRGRPGDRGRRCEAIVRDGRDGLLRGTLRRGAARARRDEFAAADLERPGADWVAPLGLRVWGRQGWTVPPNSQGYLTLASACDRGGAGALRAGRRALGARADRGVEGRSQRPRHAAARGRRRARAAGRAAARRAAREHRSRARVGARAAARRRRHDRARRRRPGGHGRRADPVELRRLGERAVRARGSRCTTAARRSRCTRATLTEYGPGRRPPHTLSPLIVCRPDGSLHTVLATMGGQAQPQILLQLLARRLRAGQSPADALAGGRWTLDGDAVAVEAHAPTRLVRRAARRAVTACARGRRGATTSGTPI